ncbi:MAG TPA: uroporphyrinogen decarboxylase family protein [Armatimonadota bacterium]|mgnify:CR=1 FL=1|nr:uroporphyrinogen decarboxylase family protein [Armatimonadota bacterium]
MRFSREQYLEYMTFGEFERPLFVELFGLLVGLEAEWRAQGATQEEIDLVAFDWDWVPVVNCGGHTGPRGLPTVILEENERELIQRDALGRTVKLVKGYATIPLPLDYPVKTMDDWLKVKAMFTFHEARINPDAVANVAKARAEGALVVASIPGAFDIPRALMGEEVACLAYYEQPELMEDILATLSDTAFRVLERVSQEVTIDQLSVHEDFAGKSGPLVGPAQIRQYFRPYYQRIWDLLSVRGARIFQQDTDGNINPVIDALLECGLTSILPMEPAAGMDVVELRRKYGRRLAMAGGIDKHVLRRSKEAIRAELEYKMQPLMRQGGYLFGLDHRIPNGTPLENYRYYVDLGREILGLPPRSPESKGWRRMAF